MARPIVYPGDVPVDEPTDDTKTKPKPAPKPAPAASAPKPKPKEDETVRRTLPDDVKAKGGVIKKMAKGGVTRGDGCAQRGHTRGRNC